jgi:hypothetical protein
MVAAVEILWGKSNRAQCGDLGLGVRSWISALDAVGDWPAVCTSDKRYSL